jgi:hypothetical protein
MIGQPVCPLGLDSQALSAWRSRRLDADDAAEDPHIASHVPTCPSCQRTLSAYDRIADALRSQLAPSPSPSLWRDLQARIAVDALDGHERRSMTQTGRRATRVGIAAVAAIAALFALLLGAFHPFGPGVAPTATSTAAQPTATVVRIKLPDFIGMQASDAEALAQQDHLKVGWVKFVTDASHPAGLVLGQDPAAGTFVQQDTEVTLTVSLGDGHIEVPDVVGKDSGMACLMLQDVGLTCNIPSDAHQYSATVPFGDVIKTDPPAGTIVDLNDPNATTVNMWVSLGPGNG